MSFPAWTENPHSIKFSAIPVPSNFDACRVAMTKKHCESWARRLAYSVCGGTVSGPRSAGLRPDVLVPAPASLLTGGAAASSAALIPLRAACPGMAGSDDNDEPVMTDDHPTAQPCRPLRSLYEAEICGPRGTTSRRASVYAGPWCGVCN